LIAAFVVAYCLGHALAMGSTWSFVPDRSWHWMFYLVPLAGVAGVISSSPKASWFNRCFLVATLAVLAGGLLSARPSLWAPRPVIVLLIFAYIVALWLSLEPLSKRVTPGTLAAGCALVAAAAAAMIAEQASLTDGKILMGAAGGFAAVALAATLLKNAEQAVGMSVPFAITLGGWAWVEALFEARLWPLLIIPLAPLAMWLTQVGPLKPSRQLVTTIMSLACVLAAVVVAGGLLRVLAR
jgi:hypothetical protein